MIGYMYRFTKRETDRLEEIMRETGLTLIQVVRLALAAGIPNVPDLHERLKDGPLPGIPEPVSPSPHLPKLPAEKAVARLHAYHRHRLTPRLYPRPKDATTRPNAAEADA